MVLSNYWKAFKLCTIATAPTNSFGDDANTDLGLVDINGNTEGNNEICYRTTYSSSAISKLVSNIHLRVFDEIRVGSGKGQIDVTDYGLFNDITNKISEPRFTVANSVMDDGISTVIVYSGINRTNEPFTITEMGVCKTFYKVDVRDNYYPTSPIMLAKVQLEKPITVQPNQPFTFNCEWMEK